MAKKTYEPPAKTNAMRLLEQAGVPYETIEYPVDESDLSGSHVAEVTGLPPEQLFKTLVARGERLGILVFCIPVPEELNLKKAAALAGDKRVELIHVKELQDLTGYMRGGCSPVGMKKNYPVFFDETVILFDRVYISAGCRGRQIIAAPEDLIRFLGARTADLTL